MSLVSVFSTYFLCKFCKNLVRATKAIQLIEVDPDAAIVGNTAYAGQVSGPAVVITHKDQLSKIKEWDILVTTSTTVDYVPYLKKVKAIVTEEWWVLSHASVIARELHIPCVIGTKIATQVLNDWDKIEVDADQGVVRIIE